MTNPHQFRLKGNPIEWYPVSGDSSSRTLQVILLHSTKMKFFGVVPLFCVALFGYLSFTQQSNATWEEEKSAGKSVSTSQAATGCTSDDNPTIVEPKDEDCSLDVTFKLEHQLGVNPNETQSRSVSESTVTLTSIGTNDKPV